MVRLWRPRWRSAWTASPARGSCRAASSSTPRAKRASCRGASPPARGTNPAPAPPPGAEPARSAVAASRAALKALIVRDLVVLRKHFWEFVARTLIQPFLLVFVFLYVFPTIGQGIAPAHAGHGRGA